MSYDGIDEETNILARLSDLAGGRILDDQPDDTDIPVDANGKVRPYVVVSIGAPFANPSGGRSMGDGEEDIPYTMTFVVGCYAGDKGSLNKLFQAVSARLVGWTPSQVGNATPIALPYAYNGATKATETKPAIKSKIMAMKCTINMATG